MSSLLMSYYGSRMPRFCNLNSSHTGVRHVGAQANITRVIAANNKCPSLHPATAPIFLLRTSVRLGHEAPHRGYQHGQKLVEHHPYIIHFSNIAPCEYLEDQPPPVRFHVAGEELLPGLPHPALGRHGRGSRLVRPDRAVTNWPRLVRIQIPHKFQASPRVGHEPSPAQSRNSCGYGSHDRRPTQSSFKQMAMCEPCFPQNYILNHRHFILLLQQSLPNWCNAPGLLQGSVDPIPGAVNLSKRNRKKKDCMPQSCARLRVRVCVCVTPQHTSFLQYKRKGKRAYS